MKIQIANPLLSYVILQVIFFYPLDLWVSILNDKNCWHSRLYRLLSKTNYLDKHFSELNVINDQNTFEPDKNCFRTVRMRFIIYQTPINKLSGFREAIMLKDSFFFWWFDRHWPKQVSRTAEK